jgi:tetratricopeptide (TPR) repeat protein
MEEGSRGNAESALRLFREAASVDPFDPAPHYQAGVAQMILERAADAAEEFRATEERAPGWFQCRSDLWLAEQIATGTLPYAVSSALRALEEGGQTPPDRLRLAELAVSKCGLAPFHHQHGRALQALDRLPEAAMTIRQGLRVAQEPDIRTRLLVDLAGVLPAGPERKALLQEAAALQGNLVAAAQAAFLERCGI